MSAPIINVKIDVTKIDKVKLFAGKNGAKYLSMTLIPTKERMYGNDYMIVEDNNVQGERGTILGNARIKGGSVNSGASETKKDELVDF